VLGSTGQAPIDLTTGKPRETRVGPHPVHPPAADPPLADPPLADLPLAGPPGQALTLASRGARRDLAELVDLSPVSHVAGLRLRPHDQIADELAAWFGRARWRALEWGRFAGQPAALDLARRDLLRYVAGTGGVDRMQGRAELARSAGWCWPFERTVVLTERPRHLHWDDHDQLHAQTGPALAYADGFALWRWRGVRVPRWVVERPDMVTLETILDEEDAQVRRVLMERYGPDRYLREAGGQVVQRDHCGNLWRAEVPGDEPLVMIEVRNATPEPDGSRRTFWLRVPPQVLTALEGVAWTFNLPPERYQPCVQT
jgi:hypothetical protein